MCNSSDRDSSSVSCWSATSNRMSIMANSRMAIIGLKPLLACLLPFDVARLIKFLCSVLKKYVLCPTGQSHYNE